jgi:uncharacterized peroxidase-related enzyme
MARLASITPGIGSSKPTVDQPGGTGQLPGTVDCNFAHLLANSPAATEGYLACREALGRGQLTAQQRELLALAVAEINGSAYCLSAHHALARKAGLSEDDIRFARKATAADPRDDAMLRFAQAVTLQRGDISDDDFQTLKRARFTDGQIAEIIANIALNVFTNYFNVAARTEVDFPPVKQAW